MENTNEQDELLEAEHEAQEPADQLTALEEILEQIEEGLSEDDTKPTLSDLIRLLELRLEFGKPQARPITVRWIDEWPPTEASEE